MNLNVTIEIWHKGKWYVAKCPELDFISQGKTREEAKKNLLDVIQIQFEEMRQIGTLDEYLDLFREAIAGSTKIHQWVDEEHILITLDMALGGC